MHIPKTAGTSFRHFLETSVASAGGKVEPVRGAYPDYEVFLDTAKERAEALDLICGHYPLHTASRLPQDTAIVTLLRDPVERCLSHIRHQIAHEIRSGEGCGESEINAFIELPHNRFFLASLRNLQVKYLSHAGPPNEAVADDRLSVERALASCEALWVGTCDALDAFQRRIHSELLALPGEAAPAAHANASEGRSGKADVTPANLAKLRELNQLDQRLYDSWREREATR